MVLNEKFDPPFSFLLQKKFGIPNGLGDTWLGMSRLGHEDENAGIYKIKKGIKRRRSFKTRFYMQWKPRTEKQIIAQNVWRSAMNWWKTLTEEEREWYNNEGKKRRMEGVNYFMKGWLWVYYHE